MRIAPDEAGGEVCGWVGDQGWIRLDQVGSGRIRFRGSGWDQVRSGEVRGGGNRGGRVRKCQEGNTLITTVNSALNPRQHY